MKKQDMTALTIVANIKANADKIDLVKAELEKLIEPTRTEEGCLILGPWRLWISFCRVHW